MSQVRLRAWFRARIIPLLALAMLVIAASAPLSFHVVERRKLVSNARVAAESVARIVSEAARERPLLWRYDAAKLRDRLASEGLLSAHALVVHDERGVKVRVEGQKLGGSLLWVRRDAAHARVWVGADASSLWRSTLLVALSSLTIALLLGAALYLLPMRAIVSAEKRVDALIARLSTSFREEERARIARDLHDGAGQALTAAKLHLLAARKEAPDSSDLEAALRHVDAATREVRRAATTLMPAELSQHGLDRALAEHCRSVAAAARIEVDYRNDGVDDLADDVAIACYRIVQEALTNTMRHAGATRASVTLQRVDHALLLAIDDDGRAGDGLGGSGLTSIRERAVRLGGSATIDDRKGHVSIAVRLPLGETA